MNKFIERYKFPLLHVWNICSKPNMTLRYEALLNVFHSKTVLKQYIMPLAEILMMMCFVSKLIFADMNFALAVVMSIFYYFSFVISFVLLFYVLKWFLLRYYVNEIENRNVSFLVSSLMSLTFAIEVSLLMMPNMFFLRMFYLYMFYLVWVMSEGVVDVDEGRRNVYMVFVSFFVIIVPMVIMVLLKKMVPNL